MKCAIYARVSTCDQEPENQLQELRRYAEARGWTAVEYIDKGVSGAKDRRPALDRVVADAKRRRFDVLIVWRLDRLGRNLKHLVTLLEELQHVGVAFVSLGEGIDCTTPAGKLQLHILAALAEFERARIAERVKAGLARVRASGSGEPHIYGARGGQPMVLLFNEENDSHWKLVEAADIESVKIWLDEHFDKREIPAEFDPDRETH